MSSKEIVRHGMEGTPTHTSWRGLLQRCRGSNSKDRKYYSEKGISFDPCWASFTNFLKDMGERPTGTSIDRIDSNKGYFKDNCKWSTPKEQVANRSTWASTGEKYISKYKYGFRVKIQGAIQKRVKTLEEAIEIRNKYALKELSYGKS
jgi:hypothetical protein